MRRWECRPLECIGPPGCGGKTYSAMQYRLYDRWAASTRQSSDSCCRNAGTDALPYQLGRPSLWMWDLGGRDG